MTYCVESDHEMAVVASKDNSILFAAISKDTVFFCDSAAEDETSFLSFTNGQSFGQLSRRGLDHSSN